jgi:4'-phosphopantetheinyl transferase
MIPEDAATPRIIRKGFHGASRGNVNECCLESHARWLHPPKNLDLGQGEVHVWRAELAQARSHAERLSQVVSTAEKERAQRFHFPRDSERFLLARGLLRILLGRYLNADPARLQFEYSSNGKPKLVRDHGHEAVQFNISHSGELMLLAFASNLQIGVDVEFVSRRIPGENIPEHFFSPREVTSLRALPPDQQTEAFFSCWTRKEAYLKARGEGLGAPLDAFEVSLVPGEPAALLHVNGDPEEPLRWSIVDLRPKPNYIGALAVRGLDFRLSSWQWSSIRFLGPALSAGFRS